MDLRHEKLCIHTHLHSCISQCGLPMGGTRFNCARRTTLSQVACMMLCDDSIVHTQLADIGHRPDHIWSPRPDIFGRLEASGSIWKRLEASGSTIDLSTKVSCYPCCCSGSCAPGAWSRCMSAHTAIVSVAQAVTTRNSIDKAEARRPFTNVFDLLKVS